MKGYRSIGESELKFLLFSNNPVYGQRIWSNIVGSGCHVNTYGTVCFFLEPYKWHDKQHKFDLVVRIPDDADIGVAVYNASPKMEETKIFTGRTGNSAVRIKEAYVRFYNPEDICELHLNGGYADWFVEETIRPFCEKYGILLYR